MGERNLSLQIFLDANFILVPCQMQIDIYSEFDIIFPKTKNIIILSAIITELEEKIKRYPKKKKLKQEYRLCLQILKNQKVSFIDCKRKPGQLVDDLLIEQAEKSQLEGNTVYIATNDKILRGKCRNKGIQIIFIRQKKFLSVE